VSARKELPPPLPPAERTVGQLVAETLRLYGDNLWPSLALGISLVVINQLSAGRSTATQVAILAAASPLMAAAFTGASAIVGKVRLDSGTAVLAIFYVLPAVAWLALFGLVVPVIVIERLGAGAALRRAVQLARADYIHALASLATLVILFGLVKLMLALLLRDLGDAGERAALGLADLVMSPVLFLGGALLYVDQRARV
jgi:hypothetical protein